MRLLLSCVNTLVSLIGYDFDRGEAFWYCPADMLRACGACYDGRDLLLASDNYLTRVSAGGISQVRLPGPHGNLAHSVHKVGDGLIGVADTGNSRLLVMGRDRNAAVAYEPLKQWGEPPLDAIHLNDFRPWGDGFLASCFHYQPFAPLKEALGYEAWKSGGFGLILHLSRAGGLDVSRVAACGLNQPHSLNIIGDRVFCCSSATGDFMEFAFTGRGSLEETGRRRITDRHFLRGALRFENGWYFGGSAPRRGKAGTPMAVYRFDDAGRIESKTAAATGEIYDVLPWREDVMRELIPVINALPKQDWEIGDCPPPCPYPG